jgi:hypothetical protein
MSGGRARLELVRRRDGVYGRTCIRRLPLFRSKRWSRFPLMCRVQGTRFGYSPKSARKESAFGA